MNWNLNRAVLGLLFLLIFANATRAQTQSEHFERGKAAIASKDYNLAIAEFTLCIQLSPANSAAHYNRALAYSRLRSYELSIADYSKAIQLKPDFLSAYINRAIQYNQLGMTDPALDDYSRAIELSPVMQTLTLVAECCTNRRSNSMLLSAIWTDQLNSTARLGRFISHAVRSTQLRLIGPHPFPIIIQL